MTTRELPREEWNRLADIPARLWPVKDATVGGTVIIAEDAGKIVGTSAILYMALWDGVWIDPAYRHGTVGRHLYREVKTRVSSTGCLGVAIDPDVQAMLAKHGERLDGQAFVMSFQGK